MRIQPDPFSRLTFWTAAFLLCAGVVAPVGLFAYEADPTATPGDSLTREITAELGRPEPKPTTAPAPVIVAKPPAPVIVAATPAPVLPKATPAIAVPQSTPAALVAATPVPVAPRATPPVAVAQATPAPVAAEAKPSITVTKSQRERSDEKVAVYHRHHYRHHTAARDAVAQQPPPPTAPALPHRNPVVSFVYWWNGFVIKTFHTKIGTVMLGTVGAKA